MRFAGQVALIAGGTGGLGRAVSLAFLAEGARVVVTYQIPEEFAGLKQAAGDGLSRLEGHDVDVTDEAAAAQLARAIQAKHGRIDVLVNAVGGYAGGARLWEQRAEAFEHMLSLNLRSGYVLSRAIAPMMLDQHRGAIVNVAAKSGLDHPAGAAAYAASKAGAIGLIDALAQELKGSGVRVNSVLPSIIDTQANRKAMPSADFSKWPKPDEIARVILFLCSGEAKVIHGASIPVYGDS
jgi:NAD(P)-dependent dehydrogenase (short-subunit alcohol dehydrogenase family)